MKYLYNEIDLNKLTKSKKRNLLLMILFFALFVISLVAFLLLSSYKNRILFSILASVIGLCFVLVAIYFVYRFAYLKRLVTEYSTLLGSSGTSVNCEILECSNFLTTLPDKSRCFEVLVKVNDKESIYYLSEIFDREDFKPGKCKILVSYDYIKGYQYED